MSVTATYGAEHSVVRPGQRPTDGLPGVRYTVSGSAVCCAAGGLFVASHAPLEAAARWRELKAEPKPSRAADELCTCRIGNTLTATAADLGGRNTWLNIKIRRPFMGGCRSRPCNTRPRYLSYELALLSISQEDE